MFQKYPPKEGGVFIDAVLMFSGRASGTGFAVDGRLFLSAHRIGLEVLHIKCRNGQGRFIRIAILFIVSARLLPKQSVQGFASAKSVRFTTMKI